MGKDPMVIVQTFRNNIMIASLMASTAIILNVGCLHLLFSPKFGQIPLDNMFFLGSFEPLLRIVKIMSLIITLSYSFFHFTWYIRAVHHMTIIFNVTKEDIKKITNKDPVEFLSRMLLRSGFHFSGGMRGYYLLIPLFLWLFHPLLMLIAFFCIIFFLIKRDFGIH